MKVSKQYLLIIAFLLCMTTACTLTPIPIPTEQTAIIKMQPQVTQTLMAETLDRKSVNDGRYFQVTPGKHRLTLLFQYEASEAGGFFINNNNTINCVISFYGDFIADTTYYLQAMPASINGANIFLKKGDNGDYMAISNANITCAPY